MVKRLSLAALLLALGIFTWRHIPVPAPVSAVQTTAPDFFQGTYQSPTGNAIRSVSFDRSAQYLWAANHLQLLRAPLPAAPKTEFSFTSVPSPNPAWDAAQWQPSGVGVVDDHHVVVANWRARNGLLLHVPEQGATTLLRTFTGPLIGPEGAAVDRERRRAGFADYDANIVAVFSLDSGEHLWSYPVRMAYALSYCNGSWYTASLGDRKIIRISNDGVLLAEKGELGRRANQYMWPTKVVCRNAEEVLALDAHLSRLCRLDAGTLEAIECAGEQSLFGMRAYLPYAILNLGDDRFLVNAAATHDLTIWRLPGWRLEEGYSTRPTDSALPLQHEWLARKRTTCLRELAKRLPDERTASILYTPTCAGEFDDGTDWLSGYGRLLFESPKGWVEWTLHSAQKLWQPNRYMYHTRVDTRNDEVYVTSPSGIYVIQARRTPNVILGLVRNPAWNGRLFEVDELSGVLYTFDAEGRRSDITEEITCSRRLLREWLPSPAALETIEVAPGKYPFPIWNALYRAVYTAAEAAGVRAAVCKPKPFRETNYRDQVAIFNDGKVPEAFAPLTALFAMEKAEFLALDESERVRWRALVAGHRDEAACRTDSVDAESPLVLSALAGWLGDSTPFPQNCR